MTERLNTNKKVVGAKQVKKALESDSVDMVYIAEDAEKKVTKTIEKFCQDKQIQITYVKNMKELGEACEIDISAATAALLK